MTLGKFISGRVDQSPHMRERVFADLPDAGLYPGGSVLAEDGQVYDSIRFPTSGDDFEWKSSSALTSLSESASYTIGASGDYPTINAALEEVSRLSPTYPANWQTAGQLKITLNILSGHVMAEQINVVGINLGFITITAQDTTVAVDPTALTRAVGGNAHALFNGFNSVMPVIEGVVFSLNSGTVPVDMTFLGGEYTPQSYGMIITSAASAALVSVRLPAETYRRVCGFNGFSYNIAASAQAQILVSGGDINDATIVGARAQTGGAITLGSTTGTGATLHGLQAVNGGSISVVETGLLTDLEVTPENYRRGASNSPSDISVMIGGVISFNSNTDMGGLSQPANILSKSGIIFSPRIVSESYGVGFIIADDAVATIVPPRLGGFLTVTVQNGTAFIVAAGGIVGYSCGASLSASELSFAGHGANLVATTGTLTGTTGVDGDVTVSARAADIQIENRLGGARTFYVSWM